MIAELSRINNQKDIRAAYLCIWTEQWLPKIVNMIKENTTALNMNRMKPMLDVEKDLKDENGTPLAICIHTFTFCYQFTQLQI